jgi:hypothetical protein
MLHVLAQKVFDQASYKEGNKACLSYFYVKPDDEPFGLIHGACCKRDIVLT